MNATAPETRQTPPAAKRETPPVFALAVSIILLWLAFAQVSRLVDTLQYIVGALVCPVWILLSIRYGYLYARQLHWKGREEREKKHLERFQASAGARKPEDYSPVDRVHAAQSETLKDVPDSQGQFRARALTLYAAPAMAVLLAGLQLALWPEGSFGAGLILGQAILALFVIIRVIVDRRPTQEWIELRTRGELFRREQYLCLARVGPYEEGRLTSPETRIAEIGAASLERMDELLRMENEDDPDRSTWLEHLASSPGSKPVFDDFPERLKTYQYHRACKQIAWMRSASEDAERAAKLIEWIAGIAAFGTILVAGGSSFLLMTRPELRPDGNVEILDAAISLGVFLPALVGMLLAIKSVFNLRMLAENYRLTECSLERLRKELVGLQEEVERKQADASVRRQLETRFQKLVLRVEAELTEEYYRWRIVTQRDTYELA
jgi:hypothetical protein